MYVRVWKHDKRHIYSRGEWKRKRSLHQLTPPSQKPQHSTGMSGSQKKSRVEHYKPPCLNLQPNLKHKGAEDLQVDTNTLVLTYMYPHHSQRILPKAFISVCKHVVNHTHSLTFGWNRGVFFVVEVHMTSGRGETSPDEKHMVKKSPPKHYNTAEKTSFLK